MGGGHQVRGGPSFTQDAVDERKRQIVRYAMDKVSHGITGRWPAPAIPDYAVFAKQTLAEGIKRLYADRDLMAASYMLRQFLAIAPEYAPMFRGYVRFGPALRTSGLGFKKLSDGTRIISGYASTPDADRVNESILVEGIDTDNYVRNGSPLMYQHDFSTIIGSVDTIQRRKKGLWVQGALLDEGEEVNADRAWRSFKRGVGAFSVGYIELKADTPKEGDTRRGKPVRVVSEIELLEVSIVTIPANPAAAFDRPRR